MIAYRKETPGGPRTELAMIRNIDGKNENEEAQKTC